MDVDLMIAAIPAKADRENNRWLPLWIHLMDTAQTIMWLYNYWLPEGERRAMFPGVTEIEALAILLALGMLHDIGKATPVFSAHISATSHMPELYEKMEGAGFPSYWPGEYAVPHAAAGEILLKRFGAMDGFASIVGAHHGKPQHSSFSVDTEWKNREHLLVGRAVDGDAWRRVQTDLIEWAESKAGAALGTLPELPQSAQALLCGLLIMADWIASNTRYFPLISVDDDGLSVDITDRFNRAMAKLHLPDSWHAIADATWGDMIYERRFGRGELPFTPRPAQRAIAQIAGSAKAPGLLILEAPMGSGKTEAALAAAELIAAGTGHGGLFFGLPTQATANAIFARVLDWAEQQSEEERLSIMLSHRMATLNPDFNRLLQGTSQDVMVGEESGLEVHDFFQGRKTALLSGFTIGTVDQLLMSALRRKHVMLRQLGLAGKVVIVDEVHAYDAYMSRYLQMVMRWLGAWGTPVILLSATLPAATRARLMDAYLGVGRKIDRSAGWSTNTAYPLLTWSDGGEVFQHSIGGDGRQTSVKLKMIEDESRIDLLRDLLSDGGCAGVICNTVVRAQSFAMEVTECLPDAEVMLCHAQFVLPDRAVIEEALLAKIGKDGTRPQKLVVVGTQVLEQSLDIDLDLLITDLCPMDLLLQRIGRLHRHKRVRPGKLCEAQCLVTGGLDETLHKQHIYAEYLLMQTRRLLPEILTLPDDISPLVQAVYREGPPDAALGDAYRTAWDRMERDKRDREGKADAYRLRAPMRNSKYAMVTLHGMLDNEETTDEVRAEASVRDGGPSVEVLLLRRAGVDRVCPVGNPELSFPLDRMPDAETAVEIARQRLRLPYRLCAPWSVDSTIQELEERTFLAVSEWYQSPWLKGELVLLLDDDGTTRLNGCLLRYDKRYGLICDTE